MLRVGVMMMHQLMNIPTQQFFALKPHDLRRHMIDERALPFHIQAPDALASRIQNSLPLPHLSLIVRCYRHLTHPIGNHLFAPVSHSDAKLFLFVHPALLCGQVTHYPMR